ncbi:FAD binding domain protein [Paraphoma chrysanthemicola]|uniref:FAD binding domain protein n=1 Tax=Paraphoma chrysanthemicola TaxID=798071 RepID=A0A8K0R4G5_9PLEO|nr:FAD binding domain protein [Paraphoma chrysanthemicola]
MHLTRSIPLWLFLSSARTLKTKRDAISSNCQKACSILENEFGSSAVHYYGSDNFTLWDAKQNDVQYACRFSPSDKTDVSDALRVLTKTWCNFAVKCGGHSRDPDFSNSVGSVTIDLRRMNSVDVATNGFIARIGGGAVVADVYAFLETRNLSFVGGRVGSVGVGGFATGGGTSPLSSREGWALENIYEYELVLANSSVVTVSEHQRPDLYWALRGAGGGNFGIITSFVVRTFPQGQLYVDRRSWNDTYTEEVVDEIYDLFTDPVNSTNAAADFYYGYVQARDGFSPAGSLRYLEPIQNPPAFASIDLIPAMTSNGQITSLGLSSGPGRIPPNPPPTRHLFQTTTTFPSRQWLQGSLQIFREEVEAVKTVAGVNRQIISYTIPERAIRGMAVRGGNALGLDDVQGPLLITFLSTSWLYSEDDTLIGEFYDRVFARLEASSKSLNVYHPYKYIGYGRLGEDIFSSYGAKNRKLLVQIQERFDPQGIFTANGLCRGGFKLR